MTAISRTSNPPLLIAAESFASPDSVSLSEQNLQIASHDRCHYIGVFSIVQGNHFQCQLTYDIQAQKLTCRWMFRPIQQHTELHCVLLKHLKVVKEGFPKVMISISLSSYTITQLEYHVVEQRLQTLASQPLTYFDLRLLNQNGISYVEQLHTRPKLFEIPAFSADLHTHFGGALSGEMFLQAISQSKYPVPYPVKLLKEMGVSYSGTVEKGMIDLAAPDTQFAKKDFSCFLSMDPFGVSTFRNMEEAYFKRGHIVKNIKLLPILLELLAEDYQKNQVKYVELSLSDIIKPEWMAVIKDVLPDIEQKYDVSIRFLVGLWRHSPRKFNLDLIAQIKAYLEAGNPYIVGVDFMGHETNSTQDFVDLLDLLAEFKKIWADFVIRVHAGESLCHPRNVWHAIQHGATRIGHGLHGLLDTETLELAKQRDVIVEANPSSNLALNNATVLAVDVPIKSLIQAGVRVTIGTDGGGIYGTTSALEAILAFQMGLDGDELASIRASDEAYIAKMNAAFKERFLNATDNTYFPLLPAPTCPNDEWSRIETERAETKKSIIKTLQETLQLEVIDCSFLTKFFTDHNLTPILFAGATTTSWQHVSLEDTELLKKQIYSLFEHLDEKRVAIITGGTDFGLEKIVHEVIHEFAQKGQSFTLLGTLAAELQADVSDISKSLTHATVIDGSWYDIAPVTLKALSECKSSIAFFMTGGEVVKGMIQTSKNFVNIDYNLLMDVSGSPSDMARVTPERGFSKRDKLEKILQLSHPNVLNSMTVNVDDAYSYFNQLTKKVVMFLGFSSDYKDPEMLKIELEKVLESHNPENTIIAAGATAVGIGVVYGIAKMKGFQTLGVVSTLAKEFGGISPHVDFALYVESDTWGGYAKGMKSSGHRLLSPVSEVIANCSHEAMMFGGGDIAKIEAEAMRSHNKDVIYFPMDKKEKEAKG